ncbi:hypothetical protein DRH29_04880 [candidate division Kazan bacterium]|uniref:Uncharacterized protein n=1 Tax=candidate division Kazan bacterium TaxID=2202143 RepID=A0A420ZBB4_UNCK3|nr:MAG: hypothetical protein DRH29_04880 [candidate division Kazan bacterium]
MPFGILRKGFTIHTPTLKFRIPKGTKVVFDPANPIITFPQFENVKLIRAGSDWFAVLWGSPFLMLFDHSRPPYPLCFYKP